MSYGDQIMLIPVGKKEVRYLNISNEAKRMAELTDSITLIILDIPRKVDNQDYV